MEIYDMFSASDHLQSLSKYFKVIGPVRAAEYFKTLAEVSRVNEEAAKIKGEEEKARGYRGASEFLESYHTHYVLYFLSGSEDRGKSEAPLVP